jgi:hypothetical protein
MKARLLKKILNDTGYNVHQTSDCICIGSPLCSNLISVNKETLRVQYALDTFHKGRESIGIDELRFIWDTLHGLIENGEIRGIIDGLDTLENPLPVYTFDDGKIISTTTDAYGWPNVTVDGELMYDNTWHKTEGEAIAYGIRDSEAYVSILTEQVERKEQELQQVKDKLFEYQGYLNDLKARKT